MSKVAVRLSGPECYHLLNLLYERRDEGSYYGNQEQYYARTERIIQRLSSAMMTHNEAGLQGNDTAAHGAGEE